MRASLFAPTPFTLAKEYTRGGGALIFGGRGGRTRDCFIAKRRGGAERTRDAHLFTARSSTRVNAPKLAFVTFVVIIYIYIYTIMMMRGVFYRESIVVFFYAAASIVKEAIYLFFFPSLFSFFFSGFVSGERGRRR